jgi:hypothetical protein
VDFPPLAVTRRLMEGLLDATIARPRRGLTTSSLPV